jgi:hypothetical protein
MHGMKTMAAFHCPNWTDGQACQPYFHVHWCKRLIATAAGIGATLGGPAVTCIKAVSQTPPAAAIAPAVWGWGCLLFLGALASIVITMNNEHDMWGCFISGIGIPALMVALISLPHL